MGSSRIRSHLYRNHWTEETGQVKGIRLLSWSPYSCRRAELGNGRSRELIVPFGAAGYVVLFEIINDAVVIGAVRHQREEDYRR